MFLFFPFSVLLFAVFLRLVEICILWEILIFQNLVAEYVNEKLKCSVCDIALLPTLKGKFLVLVQK